MLLAQYPARSKSSIKLGIGIINNIIYGMKHIKIKMYLMKDGKGGNEITEGLGLVWGSGKVSLKTGHII